MLAGAGERLRSAESSVSRAIKLSKPKTSTAHLIGRPQWSLWACSSSWQAGFHEYFAKTLRLRPLAPRCKINATRLFLVYLSHGVPAPWWPLCLTASSKVPPHPLNLSPVCSQSIIMCPQTDATRNPAALMQRCSYWRIIYKYRFFNELQQFSSAFFLLRCILFCLFRTIGS